MLASALTPVTSINVIPLPAKHWALSGDLHLTRSATVGYTDADAQSSAAYLSNERQLPPPANGGKSEVVLRRSALALPDEAYVLEISPQGILIEATTPAGWFYGVQTLLALWPGDAVSVTLPAMRIEDQPRFGWRGLMLDVSRHIVPVEGILRLLDNMAACKLNRFHWHLTDDQGWRIESRRFPLLNEISAFRRGADGYLTPSRAAEEAPHPGVYGGIYTQEEIRRVVEYAASRHITVVPEIEMPGHAIAVLAAYPQLACTSGPFETGTRMGIYDDVYCAGNDQTLAFLENIVEEVLPLFPGTFFHVGGDECRKTRWKTCPKCQARIAAENLHDEEGLQSYVIRRMAGLLASHGKRLIGWDEILEGGLPPDATVMSWRGTEGGIAAARAGHDVVMTPHTDCYLDYPQAAAGEPAAMGEHVITTETCYRYEPIPGELSADQAPHILGVQGNVWTEYMHTLPHIEYMIWPRAAAIAETGWTSPANKDFASFSERLPALERRLAASGSNYRRY